VPYTNLALLTLISIFCSGSDVVVEWLVANTTEFGPLSKAMNGSTPAHYAAIYGQLSTLKLLLQTGSKLRNDVAAEKDTQGLTVLHLASLKGDEQVCDTYVSILLSVSCIRLLST